MTSIGTDIVEIPRIESAINRWGEHFLNRIYTEAEIALCGSRVEYFALVFAAKEAVMKVLGTGAKGISWHEIEIFPDDRSKPLVKLYGQAKARAEELNLNELSISLSDTKQLALAVAIST